jgi:hypothetical protein
VHPNADSRVHTSLLRIYAVITALIGLTQVVFNGLWIGRVRAPFEAPEWLVMSELGWTFVSFLALLRWRQLRLTLLAASYVLYGSSAVVLTQLLADDQGAVTEAMVPEWWKSASVIVGVWFVAGAASLIRRTLQGSSS